MNPPKFFLCIAIASCIAIPALSQGGHGRPAKTYSADVAIAWFELMYDRVKADGISAPVASRCYGIAGVALYESIVPGMPGHASLGGQLNQLAAFTPPAQGTQFNWPTVANAALGRTLELLFSTSPNSLAAIANLRNQLSAQLAQGVNVATTTGSVARGEQIANAIAAWASTDGFATLNACPFRHPSVKGFGSRPRPRMSPILCSPAGVSSGRSRFPPGRAARRRLRLRSRRLWAPSSTRWRSRSSKRGTRLYGGIHYSLANQNGLAQGTCVAQLILATITF